ncbi:MAG: DUF11 domain-containing protein, partial [Acidimicrobiia bacterium]|nr:DUF11 domain-containing protein [Acidimicrobiia bacterium]
PAGLTLASAPGCTYDGTTRLVTCDRGTLPVGVPVTITVTTTVDADVVGGSTLVNTATVFAASDSDPSNNEATQRTDVIAESDLAVTKVSSPNPFVPGQQLAYTISVINLGPSDARNVVVVDTLPNGFYVTGMDPSLNCAQASGTVTCDYPTLAAGDAEVITVIGQTDPSATLMANSVAVVSDSIDPDPTNNTDTDDNVGAPNADLVVTKTDSVDPVVAGATLSYTITVVNNGPSDALDVVVNDTVPAEFTVTSVSRVECDTTISCTFPVLGAGETVQITVTGTVDPALTDTGDPSSPELVNSASVSSETNDGDPTNNGTVETTDVVESADVVITKIGQGSDITPGVPAVFTVEVINVGPSDADNVVVTDRLPTGLTFVSATGATCAKNPTDPTMVLCELGTLLAGDPAEVITLTVDVAPDVAGGVVNEAEVTSTTPDPVPDNNVDTSEDPASPDADLAIDKVDLADPVTAGSSLSYRLTVRNGGPSVATSVTVTDNLPSSVRFVSAALETGIGTCLHDGSDVGGTMECALAALDPGQVVAVDVAVDVLADTPDGTILDNIATVSSDSTDPNPADNSDPEDTLVQAVADVGVTKVASVAEATPGEAIIYTIRVRNNGPSNADDVSLTDDLPAGLIVTNITGATCDSSEPIVCELGTLVPGEEIVIVIEADIDSRVAQSLINTVEVTTSTNDPNPDNDVADTEVPVEPLADLSVDKTGPATVVAGTSMVY